MPAEDEDAARGPTGSLILQVADGLRWRDPRLSAALAEHAVRLADGDAGLRAAAEHSAVLALGQLDRGPDVVARAVPQLRDAERGGRTHDAAALRCELACAAVGIGTAELAEDLLEPLAGGETLPVAVRVEALTAWSRSRASRGDVAGTDAAVLQAEELLGSATSDAMYRIDLLRIRAQARRAGGDAAGALDLLRAAPPPPGPAGADGGRRAAQVVADEVDLLLDQGRTSEAGATAAGVLTWEPDVTTAVALARVRCALAGGVHLPAGELDAAASLARAAGADLGARGHLAETASALELLATIDEARGDLRAALDGLRRAHDHDRRARDELSEARQSLAAVSAMPRGRERSGAGPAPGPPTDRRHAEVDGVGALRGNNGGGRPPTDSDHTESLIDGIPDMGAHFGIEVMSRPDGSADGSHALSTDDGPAVSADGGPEAAAGEQRSGRRRAPEVGGEAVGLDGDRANGRAGWAGASLGSVSGPAPWWSVDAERVPARHAADDVSTTRSGGPVPGPAMSEAGTPGPAMSEAGTPGPAMSEAGTPGPAMSEAGTPDLAIRNSAMRNAAMPDPDQRFAPHPDGSGLGPSPVEREDEHSRELALTLAGLLAEYEDDEPIRSTIESIKNGVPGASPPWLPPRTNGSEPPSTSPPPRLADLLAEAMDAYHGSTPSRDGRWARG